MLTFLRKYQKIFLSIVAVFTITSFLFFGAYNVLEKDPASRDIPLGTTVDHKPLMQRELFLLMRFLNTSHYEGFLLSERMLVNLLNDGVVQKDFIETGMLSVIAGRYFDLFKEETEKRFERVKRYHPYVHPQTPHISARRVWKKFAPTLLSTYENLENIPSSSPKTIELLLSLYLDQGQFSPHMLKSALEYEESLENSLVKDPLLPRMNLALFGFSTLEDWLGRRFVHFLSQVILNGAALAREEGLCISREEAKLSLQENFQKNLLRFGAHTLTAAEKNRIYENQCAFLEASKEDLVELWQKVLLFRKFCEKKGASLLVPPALFTSFSSFASETVTIDLYSLPPSLQLRTFRDLLKLETYLEFVTTPSERKITLSSLLFPTSYAKVEEVKKRCPELVSEDFHVQIKEVSLDELAKSVSLKSIHSWELAEKNWEFLKNHCEKLRSKPLGTLESRLKELESLDTEERVLLDFSAKKMIVKEHPEWLRQAFLEAKPRDIRFSLRTSGGELPFKGIHDQKALQTLLHETPLGTMIDYSQGDEHHYQITLLSPPTAEKILHFSEVFSDGTLDFLLDQRLCALYPELKKKHQALFSMKGGGWKPFKEVKDLIGAELYTDLLHTIESKSTMLRPSNLFQDTIPLDGYASLRCAAHLHQTWQDLLAIGDEVPLPDTKNIFENNVHAQWQLVRKKISLTRLEAQKKGLFGLFEKDIGYLSKIQWGKEGDVYFYHVRSKEAGDINPESMAQAFLGVLAKDEKRLALEDLLERMTLKNVIIELPLELN